MRALIAAAALGLCALAAHAEPIDPAIGHALKITDASGNETVYRLQADNTFDAEHNSGTWRAEEGRLCLDLANSAELCLPYAEEKQVGDTWTIQGPTGRTAFTLSLED